MARKLKVWTGLGVMALTGVVAANAAQFDHKGRAVPHKQNPLLWLADASGEGESGDASSSGDERLDYLTDLGLAEGHMRVGVELYRQGYADAAKTHMRHPGDELYEDLLVQFKALKVKGFAAELKAVADAVGRGAPISEVDAAMEKLLAAIAAARGPAMSSAETARTIHMLVRQAAVEYVAGIEGDKVSDPHEYQDAWGFVQTAKAYLASVPDDERQEHAGPFGEIAAQLAALDVAWPNLAGSAPVTGDPTLLPAAAAHIELASLAIK